MRAIMAPQAPRPAGLRRARASVHPVASVLQRGVGWASAGSSRRDRQTSISTTSSIGQTASWLLTAGGQQVDGCVADRIRRTYPLPRRHTLVPTRLPRLPVRQAIYTITRSSRAPLSSRHRWPISARPTLPCVELRMSSEQELEPADQALHVGDHRAPCTRDL